MALSGVTVDWPTGVITVPREGMTLVQSTPTEIREMNLNEFRLALKDLEDDFIGMPYLKTHDHNTEVNLGGITYARIIEILDPYTITFENGFYAVNLFGANSNVGDKTNVNNVSVRSNNSAGLISTPLIEYAAFEGGVWYDEINGTEGQLFPIGARPEPAKIWSDVKAIATYRGFNVVYIVGDANLDDSADFSEFVFEGQTHVNDVMTVYPEANVAGGVFRNLTIRGTLDGGNEMVNCTVSGITYVNGHIHNCELAGNIALNGNNDAVIANCITVDPYNPPTIDMGVSGHTLAMPNYSGILEIYNFDDPLSYVGIGLDAGTVILRSDVTRGNIQISGNGVLLDENGASILTGIWNGGVNVVNNLTNKNNIAIAVWDTPIENHVLSGTTGQSLGTQQYENVVVVNSTGVSGTTYPIGTYSQPVNNIKDAISIANYLGIIKIVINTNTTIYSGDSVSGYVLTSDVHATVTVEPGAFTLYTNFNRLHLTGDLGEHAIIEECTVASLTNFYGIMDRCVFGGDVSISSDNTRNAVMLDCYTGDVAAPPTIDLGGDGAKLSLRGLTGALYFTNKTGDTQLGFIDLYSARVGFDSTITYGHFTIRGIGYIYQDDTHDRVTFDLQGLMSKATISVAVWDEILNKTTHNLPNSAGRRLRGLSSIIIYEDDIISGTTNTVKLGGASTDDGAYDPSMITITDGTGAGQTRMILEYQGAEQTAVVDRDWKIIPDDTSVYLISANPGREHVNEGLAQSGTTTTIQLNPLASSLDNAYTGQVVFIRSGTGEDQAFRVLEYDGTTKVATMAHPWGIIPDNTSAYVMLPGSTLDTEALKSGISDAVWNAQISGYTQSGSAGITLSGSTAEEVWNYPLP